MATARKLSDMDVKTVYECVYNNRRPPPHLSFKIVVVGPEGQRLSPPSIEFEDGIYILLRPQKKRKMKKGEEPPESVPPIVPSNLVDYVMKEDQSLECPWQLSGPQFPKKTVIQQRYCYPKGRSEYSAWKGGSLWTIHNEDGKEDVEYRLFHVYYSAKRAHNRGMNTPGDQSSKASSRKKPKRSNVLHQDSMFSPSSPVTASVTSSICTSPLSFDMPPPSPKDSTLGYLSPTFLRDDGSGLDRSSLFYPAQVSNQSHVNYSHAGGRNKGNVGRPNYNRNYDGAVSQHHWNPRAGYGGQMNRNPPSARWPENNSGYSSNEVLQTFDTNLSQLEPFPLDMEDPLFDLESTWADPTPMVSPAQYPTQSANKRACSGNNMDNLQSFNNKLDAIHENLKETMMRSSRSEQGRMLSMLSSWARNVAQSPFGVHQTNVRRGKALVSPAKSETQRTPKMHCQVQASV